MGGGHEEGKEPDQLCGSNEGAETDMVWDPAEFKFQDQSRPSWNY